MSIMPGEMSNAHLLELPLSRTYFTVPKVFEPLKFYTVFISFIKVTDTIWCLNIIASYNDSV